MGVERDVPLAPLTTLRVGGPARTLVRASGEDALVEAVRAADAAGEPVLLLAGGSNLLVADAGFDGLVVVVDTRGVDVVREGGSADEVVRLTVAAGEPWDAFVARCVADGLAGVECLSGIPGSVGATPIQNVGAYGQEVAGCVVGVRAYDRSHGLVVDLTAADCGFGYRTSRFKAAERDRDRYVVLSVTFALRRAEVSGPLRYAELARALEVPVGAGAPLARVRASVLALRRGKGMVLDPDDPDSVSAGSFFTNPVLDADAYAALVSRAGESRPPPAWPEPDGRVKTSAAWLIEHTGFQRGHGDGRAGLSRKHTLAIVNRGGASAADLVALAREVRDGVRVAFGVELMPEPVLVGVDL